MRIATFESDQVLPRAVPEVFEFFADARNLQVITPAWLNFVILTPGRIEMRPGAQIEYRLRIHGIPVQWESAITVWEPPYRFVDEQRRGPYRLWVHEHTFEGHSAGTLAKDRVRYAVPGGWLIDQLFVRRDVEKIFAFRRKKLREIFGA